MSISADSEQTKKAFASTISGASGSRVNQLELLRSLPPRTGSTNTGPIGKYFSLQDSDNPFTRLNYGLRSGTALGLIFTTVYCPFNHLIASSPMANVITGIRIVGFSAAAGATHSACVSVFSSMRHNSDDWKNHFMAGIVSGCVLASKSSRAGPVFYSAAGVALVTSFLKLVYDNNWAFLSRSKMPTLTGIRNNQCYLSLNQKYMNPEWRDQEAHLEEHL